MNIVKVYAMRYGEICGISISMVRGKQKII